jgi:uncharacterized protein YjdB
VDISPPIVLTAIGAAPTQFTATPRDGSGNALTGRTIVWTSSDPTVVSIDDTGLATPIAVGFPTITASSEGVNSPSVIVTVLP